MKPSIKVNGHVVKLGDGRLGLQKPDGKLQGVLIVESGELVIRERRTDVVYKIKINELDKRLEVW